MALLISLKSKGNNRIRKDLDAKGKGVNMTEIFDLLGKNLSLDEQEEIILAILAYAVKKLRPELGLDDKLILTFDLRSEM